MKKRKRLLEQIQLDREDSSEQTDSEDKSIKSTQPTDQNGNEGNLTATRKKPKRHKGIIKRTEYLSKEDLDFRPYAQRKHLIKDHKLENFLKSCKRRFRRRAVCVEHEEDNQDFTKFVEELATVFALKTCF